MEKFKILLDDNEPKKLKALFEVLSPEFNLIFVASNGNLTINQVFKQHPDAIFKSWDKPVRTSRKPIKSSVTISPKI